MTSEYELKYDGPEIDRRLELAGSSVTYTAQNLTQAQKIQVRENIGATDYYSTIREAAGKEHTDAGWTNYIYNLYRTLPGVVEKEVKSNDGSVITYEYIISTGEYSTEGNFAQPPYFAADTDIKKPKYLILSGVHGIERNAVLSVYRFAHDVVYGYNVPQAFKEGVILHILPVGNPYGLDAFTLYNADNININRNFDDDVKAKETQAIINWMTENSDANLFIDVHNGSALNETAAILGDSSYDIVKTIKKIAVRGIDRIIPFWRDVMEHPAEVEVVISSNSSAKPYYTDVVLGEEPGIFAYCGDAVVVGATFWYALNMLSIPSISLEMSDYYGDYSDYNSTYNEEMKTATIPQPLETYPSSSKAEMIEAVATGAEVVGNILIEVYNQAFLTDMNFVSDNGTSVEVVQTTGESETAVMSQKSVSNFFRKNNPPIEFAMIDGELIQSSGNSATVAFAQHSDFIPVTEGEQYRLYTYAGNQIPAAVFFKEAQIGSAYDAGYIGDLAEAREYRNYEFTIPGGANYIVLNIGEPASSGAVPVLEKISMDYIGNVPTELDSIKEELNAYATLKGRTIVNLGDSIFGQEVRDERNPVSKLLGEYTGATVINCAFGGTRMTSRGESSVFNAFDFPSIAQAIIAGDFTTQENTLATDNAGDNVIPYQYDRILPNLKAVDWSKVDIVTLNYGTNDWTAGVTLDNFKAAAIANMGALMAQYPHITFVLITPTWRFWYNADGSYMEDSNVRENGGHNLIAVCEADKEIAASLNINLINAYNIGINQHNRAYYFPTTELDGTHHAENGRKRLARYLASQIMSIM